MHKNIIFNVTEKNKYENRDEITEHIKIIVDKLIMNEVVKKFEQ